MLTALTAALGVERSILATDDQIAHVWSNLPRLISRIPPEQRSETLVRMCVAVAAGLLDSAINYAWNAAVIELRDKVRRFGLTVGLAMWENRDGSFAPRDFRVSGRVFSCYLNS